MVALGRVKLAGETFAVARHGDLASGKEGAIAVTRVGAGEQASLFLWLEDAAGAQVSAPVSADGKNGDWHFHVTPRADAGTPAKVVLRVRNGSIDERGGVDVHAAAGPSHDGVAAPIVNASGAVQGWLELKLHDDKGDLELWLTSDGRPLDIPANAVIKAMFPGQNGRTVELRVRNTEKNEDEAGKANMRDGATNYFIFPGDSGADASWLADHHFASPVMVTIPMRDGAGASGPFILVPHAHHGHHEH